MNLSRIDLNLFIVFDAIYTHHSLHARRVFYMSPSPPLAMHSRDCATPSTTHCSCAARRA